MENHKQSARSAAHEADAGTIVPESGVQVLLQVSKEEAYEGVEDSNRKLSKKSETFQEDVFKTISQQFPEAADSLKKRLVTSTQHRRARFLGWKNQDEEALASGKVTRALTESELKSPRRPFDPANGSAEPTESTRWKNKMNFPKHPQLVNSQSHFKCDICFLSIPSKEGKEEAWLEHVIQDLIPYTCVLENCQSLEIDFGTFENWTKHMKQHQEDSAFNELKSCPLCAFQKMGEDTNSPSTTKDEELLHQHIACHLQSIALISLLPSHPNTEPDPKSSNLSRPLTQLDSLQLVVPFSTGLLNKPKLNIHGTKCGIEPVSPYFLGGDFDSRGVPQPSPEGNRTKQNYSQNLSQRVNQNITSETYDILIAEDNPVNQKIMFHISQKNNHKSLIVNNGQEALEAFKQKKYDLILMDLSLPVMSGFESTEKIREYERMVGRTRTPIIALTAGNSNQDWEQILRHQMDSLIFKPLELRILREEILKYGRLGRSAGVDSLNLFLASIHGGDDIGLRNSAVSIKARL